MTCSFWGLLSASAVSHAAGAFYLAAGDRTAIMGCTLVAALAVDFFKHHFSRVEVADVLRCELVEHSIGGANVVRVSRCDFIDWLWRAFAAEAHRAIAHDKPGGFEYFH